MKQPRLGIETGPLSSPAKAAYSAFQLRRHLLFLTTLHYGVFRFWQCCILGRVEMYQLVVLC